jgi:hypothetical protein
LPVHADDIAASGRKLSALVLPNLGALSDAQCKASRAFVQAGGSLIATGASSLYNEWGDPREDFALADLFGAHFTGSVPQLVSATGRRSGTDRFSPDGHTYLRLIPEWRAKVDGPKSGDEPAASGERHPVLRGFEETDIIPYGGGLRPLRTAPGAVVPLTFVPPFPTYPPETAWMREPKTEIPGLVLSSRGNSRVAYLQADIDRRYAREHLTDHGDLLANIARWAVGDSMPFTVEGPGFLDCHLYRQGGRAILHLVNLTSAGTWRAPVDELIPVGPLKVTIRGAFKSAEARVRIGRLAVTSRAGAASFTIPSILDHEMVVLA